ncbi:uncharacterized protein LOC141830477 [Curcuma longa]|uniref:uncharacterized protein LOC141830477 n=1 Tax=Curcuma longa TaxID=136217 RepID=UPI003D9F7F69
MPRGLPRGFHVLSPLPKIPKSKPLRHFPPSAKTQTLTSSLPPPPSRRLFLLLLRQLPFAAVVAAERTARSSSLRRLLFCAFSFSSLPPPSSSSSFGENPFPSFGENANPNPRLFLLLLRQLLSPSLPPPPSPASVCRRCCRREDRAFLFSAPPPLLRLFLLFSAPPPLLRASVDVSFGPISWLMVSEVFPIRTRGRGISLAVLTNFGANALVTFAFSPLKELLGPENIFLLFGVIALLSLAFVLFYVPETKGLSLEEIEAKILK